MVKKLKYHIPLNPLYDAEQEWYQTVSIGLIINKFMEQIGDNFRTNVGQEYQVVNYARHHKVH